MSAWTIGDVTTCDVTDSSLNNMSQLFQFKTNFNQDLSAWDTSNVADMSNMFKRADAFNQDISDWDVSNVTNMQSMFQQTGNFNNGGVALDWSNTSSVTNMSQMFDNADGFNQDLIGFDTSNVTTMRKMFSNVDIFNQDIRSWDTGNVTNMQQMFRKAVVFNQDIRGWDVAKVSDFSGMFIDATAMHSTYSGMTGFNNSPTAAFFRDIIAPTLSGVSIASNNATPTQAVENDVVTLTFTASEVISTPVVTFKSGAVAITDTSITYVNTRYTNSWTAAYTVNASDTSGAVTFSVAFSDTAATGPNAGTAVTSATGSVTASLDTTAPTMAITSAEVSDGGTSNDATLSLTFTASEATSNFAVGDITVSGGALSSFAATSSTVYTATFTPSSDGATTIDVAASTFTDAASNNNTAAPQFNWTYDSTAPTMAIAASQVSDGGTSNDATLSLTFTSSKPTTNFAVGDITVSGGALSSFAATSTTVYTATFTPSSDGATTIDVAASTFTDAASNNNTAAPQFNWTYDSTVPTLSGVSLASSNATATEGFAGDVVTLTFTASETITTPDVTFKSGGADITDTSITYANASGNIWTAAYTVSANDTAGAVSYSIGFNNSVGNAGTAVTSGTGSVTIYPTPAVAFAAELTKINAKIASFAQAELNNLSATMSGISSSARGRFISKSTCSDLEVSSTDPDYLGGVTASGSTIATNLSMTKSSKSYSSEYCTYTSADVFFNRNEDNSFSRGAAGQIQFERSLNDKTMLGYFVGGSIGLMNEGGTLTTSMEAVGIKLGSYFVRELDGNLILDGYASVVTSSNNLRFTTDIMTAKSNYNTQAGAVGLNLTGIIPLASMEIRPTGSLSLTRSIGQTVNFDVTVGSASSTETATHGSITQSKLSFAPEVRMPFSQTSFGGISVATFTPKVTCQEVSKTTTTRNCGQGIALGMDTISKDGLTNVIVGTSFDQMGGQSSTSIDFKVMKQW